MQHNFEWNDVYSLWSIQMCYVFVVLRHLCYTLLQTDYYYFIFINGSYLPLFPSLLSQIDSCWLWCSSFHFLHIPLVISVSFVLDMIIWSLIVYFEHHFTVLALYTQWLAQLRCLALVLLIPFIMDFSFGVSQLN